jgi:hypothetical protein
VQLKERNDFRKQLGLYICRHMGGVFSFKTVIEELIFKLKVLQN